MIYKIKLFFITIIDVIKEFFNNKEVLAKDSVIENRRNICNSCPFQKKIGPIKQCGKCGCAIEAKIQLKASKCPCKKW